MPPVAEAEDTLPDNDMARPIVVSLHNPVSFL
jgi:hypothetical protein